MSCQEDFIRHLDVCTDVVVETKNPQVSNNFLLNIFFYQCYLTLWEMYFHTQISIQIYTQTFIFVYPVNWSESFESLHRKRDPKTCYLCTNLFHKWTTLFLPSNKDRLSCRTFSEPPHYIKLYISLRESLYTPT